MFRVHDVILSEDIATAKFACDISKCKGACCVIGDAGAPVVKDEIPVLNKAFRKLKHRLTDEAIKKVMENGVVSGDSESGYEINCVDTGECIFVERNEDGVATCAIQNAYYNGNFNWEKPISCHLYPVRLKRISGFDYANFEYIPELCKAGCINGDEKGVYLSDFLKTALVRRYGEVWYKDFKEACEDFINEEEVTDA